MQKASSRLHYPGACIFPYLAASRRPCYPAASQYLHKEPQVLRLHCLVPVVRHHTMSRPLQSQRSRHISCLTTSFLPCLFIISTEHITNSASLRSMLRASFIYLSVVSQGACQQPLADALHSFINQRHPQFVVACRLTRRVS